jgi:SAM-dependent methyltransferase
VQPWNGLNVLEIGSRSGRFAQLFADLGAHVLGVDIPKTDSSQSHARAATYQGPGNLRFEHYSGAMSDLPIGPWNVIITKSVLVVLDQKDAIETFSRLLSPGGHYVALENLRLPGLLNRLRTYSYASVDGSTIRILRNNFKTVRMTSYFGLVVGLVATKSSL